MPLVESSRSIVVRVRYGANEIELHGNQPRECLNFFKLLFQKGPGIRRAQGSAVDDPPVFKSRRIYPVNLFCLFVEGVIASFEPDVLNDEEESAQSDCKADDVDHGKPLLSEDGAPGGFNVYVKHR